MRAAFAVAVLLLLPACSGVAAQNLSPLQIHLTGASQHYVSGDYNSVNPGFLLASDPAQPSEWSRHPVVGFYQNSYSKGSLIAGVGVSYQLSRYIRLAASGGVATGYSRLTTSGPAGATPMLMHLISVGPPGVKVTIYHLPGAVGIGLTLRRAR